MLKKVSRKNRYKGVRIADFKTVNDSENNTQFSAGPRLLLSEEQILLLPAGRKTA